MGNSRCRGAVYDIGSYCINGIRVIMGDEPEEVRGLAHFSPDGVVDLAAAVSMKFPGGRIAQFDCSFESVYNQSVLNYRK